MNGLAKRLNDLIAKKAKTPEDEADLVGRMASAAGIEIGTVRQILRGEIETPPPERISGFAKVLGVSVKSLEATFAAPASARIEVFRPGTFRPMEGEPITYSAADLRAIADVYDPETAPAPVVVGHPATDAPAFGWVSRFDYDAGEGRLFAELHDVEPQFAEMVRAGRFRKVSMAFFGPGQSHNPVPGAWYPKHVGFLGAAAPAVPGLRNASFAVKADVTIVTAFAGGRDGLIASLLRGFREFVIEKFSLEEADRALPGDMIEFLGTLAAQEPVVPEGTGFAAPTPHPDPSDQEDKALADPKPDAAFAAREAQITAREAAIAAREAAAAHADNLAFAEGLVSDGRLPPAARDKVVAILDALPAEAAVRFAEGGAEIAASAALREVLGALPKVAHYGAFGLPEGGDAGGGRQAAFASDGKPVDPAGLETHRKALDYQRLHPKTDYLDAVRAVS